VKRRRWALGAAAGGAALCGMVWRWQQDRAAMPLPSEGEQLWALRFPRPDGGELVMASLRGKPLVLNFWATWCPPCIKEMPQIDQFHRTFSARGWAVVGLAVDTVAPVREFLARQPVGFAVGLAGFEGTALSRELGNDRGALPFTAVFDRGGRIVQRKLGETSFDELSRWAEGV
jgi:thiol-disulfide isomerase/thioredoxin